jgi:hypothetical protein
MDLGMGHFARSNTYSFFVLLGLEANYTDLNVTLI